MQMTVSYEMHDDSYSQHLFFIGISTVRAVYIICFDY